MPRTSKSTQQRLQPPSKARARVARKPATVDAYLKSVSGKQRALLEKLRRTIRATVPDAEECISYAMPAFRVRGKVIAGFAARSSGGSYYPFSGSTLATLSGDLRHYDRTKSALHFSDDKPLSAALVRKLLETRIAETSR